MFGIEGDVTKKQLKKLRKASSVFVRDTLANDLTLAVKQAGLSEFVTIKADPDGEGDATYPEPRQIHIIYKSVLPSGTNILGVVAKIENMFKSHELSNHYK